MTRSNLAVLAAVLSLALAPLDARPEYSGGVVKLGVLTDLTGPWREMGGAGSTVAANMAVEDCLAAECKGMKIEVLTADHQNKADVGLNRAREWFDKDGVDAIVDLTNSAVSLAVQKLAKAEGRIVMFSGPATTRLTGDECSPTGFHWMFDTYALSVAPARKITKAGGSSWFFLTVDYAFGHSLEKDASEMVKDSGGQVLGAVRFPLNSTDFGSFLLAAQASKAKVIALATGGTDAVNAVKAAHEFGVVGGGQQLAPLLLFLTDVKSLGLKTAQGLSYVEGFYWDLDDATRAWSAKFQKRHKAMPTQVQAGVYSSVLHYLRAVAATRSDDAKVVAPKMRELPIRDPIMRNASIRADGRVLHDMYLLQVKKPSDSKGEWDLCSVVATIPAAEAFTPLAKSACPLVKS